MGTERLEADSTRREFLRSLGRGTLAVGLVAGAWSLLSRQPGGCAIAASCTGCPRLSGCTQPQAREERQGAEVSGHGR